MKDNKIISMLIAVDDKNGIGKKGDLPWRLSGDMNYFKKTSVGINDDKVNAVIMGRKTWDSIPVKYRPLSDRVNYVLTRNETFEEDGAIVYNTLESCLESISNNNLIDEVFIIGGGNLYNQVLENTLLDKIYITQVEGDFDCDVFFNGVPKNFKLESVSDLQEENDIKYKFFVYKRNK